MSGNTNNPIEFLVNLGVDTPESKKNIQDAITSIQRQLDTTLDTTLTVNTKSEGTSAFDELKSEFDKLKKQLDDLNNEFANVGSGKGSGGGKPFGKPLAGANDLTISLEQLRKKAVEANASLDFKYAGDDLTKYKTAVIGLTNDMGELQKVSYEALYNDKGDLQGFKAIETTTKNTDFDKFNKKLTEAKSLLTEFGKQGKLSTEELRAFQKSIDNSVDNKALSQVVKDLKLANSEAGRRIENSSISQINKDAEDLIVRLKALGRNNDLSLAGKDFNDLIIKATDLSQRKIFNDQNLKEARSDLKTLNSEFNVLTSQATKFGGLNDRVYTLVRNLESIGTLSTDRLIDTVDKIQIIGQSSATTAEKVNKLKLVLTNLNDDVAQSAHANKMAQSMKDASLEVRRLEIELTKIENQWKKTVNPTDVARLRGELASLTVPKFSTQAQSKEFMNDLKNIRTQISLVRAEATQSARSSMSVIDSFKVAMERFPIWMASSTLFYGAVRGVQDLTEKVIELDSNMTNLRRVMDEPDYKFNEMLEQSISNVEALSSKLPDMMKLVEEYGRMGFSSDQVLDMANTSAMLANISDLDANESVDALVASMIAFNIEGTESIRIADMLNEVDNNFSVSTKNLALSLNKASSTAKTFGVTMEEMIGNVTAISELTRESGNIVGNSLKSIYARIQTNSSAINALEAIGIALTNIDGSAKSSSELLAEVAGKWDELTESQKRTTSTSVAGIYQLSR